MKNNEKNTIICDGCGLEQIVWEDIYDIKGISGSKKHFCAYCRNIDYGEHNNLRYLTLMFFELEKRIVKKISELKFRVE